MTDESVDKKCECGRPATERSYISRQLQCIVCSLVERNYTFPPRPKPGNVSDEELVDWVRERIRRAIEDTVARMRSDLGALVKADLDALDNRWNPPVDDSSQDGDQQDLPRPVEP